MVSIDKAAIIWSIAIVIIGVGFAAVGNNDDNNHLASEIDYGNEKTGSVFPGGMSAKPPGDVTPTSIFLKTDRQTYSVNDKIKISGSVDAKLSDTLITMIISAPNGDIVTIAQMEVDDNRSFDTTVPIGGALWKQEGEYTIRINYGKENTRELVINFVLPKATSDTSDVFDVTVNDKIFPVEYTITNAKVQNMIMDSDCFCMIVTITDTQDFGMLVMDMPRALIDAKMRSGGQDDMFFVLMDGIEIPYDEISSNSQSRKIQIDFEKGTSDIEVIGTG